jgi:hypothetical protein
MAIWAGYKFNKRKNINRRNTLGGSKDTFFQSSKGFKPLEGLKIQKADPEESAFCMLNRKLDYPIETRLKADTVNPLLTLSKY